MGIAKILANHPNFKDKFNRGFYAVGVMTGGGFGSVDINVLNDNKVMIRTSESGHNLAFDPIEKKVLRLGKLGASAKCVIENYSEALGIKDENKLKALINTGDARIATNEEITLKTDKDAIAIETLLETGVYKVKEKLDGKTVLQVDSSYTRKQSSTGLGLTITKELIELHGGKIWIESKLNEGTTFTFELPVNER